MKNFWKVSKASRELAELHINYESVPPYEGVKVYEEASGFYQVEKNRIPKKKSKSTIVISACIFLRVF